MPITCKNGGVHQHDTVAEVRACWGRGEMQGTPVGTYSRPARDRDVTPQWNGFNVTAPPSAKQVKYLNDLLRQAKLQPVGWDAEHMARPSVSEGITQLKAYLNRTRPLPTFAPVAHVGEPVSATPTRKPYPDVPAGHYATISATGNNDYDFWRVDRPDEGPWKGRTFVKRVIGGKPNKNVYRQTALDALKAILDEGIEVTRTRYGTEIGQCWKCNRHLTDETSRALGIGPDCRSK